MATTSSGPIETYAVVSHLQVHHIGMEGHINADLGCRGVPADVSKGFLTNAEFSEILGLGDQELAELREQGVI